MNIIVATLLLGAGILAGAILAVILIGVIINKWNIIIYSREHRLMASADLQKTEEKSA